MLIFFHLYWLDIKQDIADHSQYLNKISVLLNVYINIELKTSMEKRISNQVRDKIAAKILAALYIYLNNSEEHIFRVLLRIKHTTEKYTKICNHIFTKSFTNLKTQTISINDVTYIRYLLAFKMWKKSEETIKNLILKKKLILSEEEMRRFEESLKEERINKLALKLLGSRMPKLQDKLKFVPRPPEGQENETLWLIKSDLFDKKEVHKKFLLFEDKMDNSTDLQYNKTIYTDQNCLKSQKHQTNSSGDTSEQKIKKYLGGLRKNNTLSNNENRSDQIYLQKKGSKSLKRMKKKRKKSIGKPIEIIDLTGDDKRKRIKNSKCLKVMKNIMRSKKHINSLKYSNKLMNADVKECSYEDDKNLEDYLMYKSVHDIEISDLTGVCTSVNSRASLNDSCLNPETNEHLNVTNNQMSNICLEFMKEDEKSSMCVEYQSSQNIKEFKTNMKESKLNNCVSPYKACMTIGNAINSYNNSQNKEALTSQEESAMETILKPCQNNADQHSFKQELPSMNCSAMQKPHECYKNNINDDEFKHDVLKKLEYLQRTTDRVQEAIHSSQITKINQKVCQGNGCQNYITKIDCKPFTNNDTAIKAQGTSHTFNDNYNNTFNDNYKCVYVVNHIDEYVTVHAEKRVQRLDKSNDTCTVSTTFTEDQIVELPLYNHVNFDNVRTNDYDNTKYSETMIKEQQKMTDCDSSILDDRLLFSECVLDVNSFDIDSNAEVENKCRIDLKSFPKIEETEITKTDVGDFEHINSNDIQSETLEDFFRQFSEQPQINYNNLTAVSTKKSLMYDNDISTVKTQNTLNNIFNTDDTNIICMLSDRNNKCIYVTNHTGDRIMTNTEKKIQHLNNSNDMCTVSTTFTEDQIVESSFDSQHVNSDNRRKCDYKDDFKYPENMMKEQQRKNNCDTSMLNELHPTELPTCTLIDSFELDSKEATEIMKTDCNDIENISFSHNMQTEIERILSNIIFPPTEAVTI